MHNDWQRLLSHCNQRLITGQMLQEWGKKKKQAEGRDSTREQNDEKQHNSCRRSRPSGHSPFCTSLLLSGHIFPQRFLAQIVLSVKKKTMWGSVTVHSKTTAIPFLHHLPKMGFPAIYILPWEIMTEVGRRICRWECRKGGTKQTNKQTKGHWNVRRSKSIQ